MLESVNRNVGGQQVTITPYPAGTGLSIFVDLTRLFSPAIKELSGVLKDKDISSLKVKDILDSDANFKADEILSVIGSAIEKASSNTSGDEFVRLCLRILSSTKVNNIDIDESSFSSIFMGQYKFLFSLLKEVIKFNYSDFLAGTAKSNQAEG